MNRFFLMKYHNASIPFVGMSPSHHNMADFMAAFMGENQAEDQAALWLLK